jgi:CHRD domain
MQKRIYSTMKVFSNRRRFFTPVIIMLSACVALLMAACSTSQQTVTISGNSNNSSTSYTAPIEFNTQLTHSPTGSANLSWNPEDQKLTVQVSLTGLAPNSTHPEHIHAGSCTSMPMGPIVYTLNPIVADAHGVATVTTIIANVKHGIPENGWYVNVHNGPQLTTDLQGRAIACGNVYNAHTSKDNVQTVHLQLVKTTAPDEAVYGNAQISIENNELTVKLTLHGLVPQSTHMAHIHAGTCQSQGAVVYPLKPVVADGNGDATSTTVINNIKTFSASSLYVNVHEAGTMSGMSTQSGFNPIACGNIAAH